MTKYKNQVSRYPAIHDRGIPESILYTESWCEDECVNLS